jgi:hypothetical protein
MHIVFAATSLEMETSSSILSFAASFDLENISTTYYMHMHMHNVFAATT